MPGGRLCAVVSLIIFVSHIPGDRVAEYVDENSQRLFPFPTSTMLLKNLALTAARSTKPKHHSAYETPRPPAPSPVWGMWVVYMEVPPS